MAGAGPVPPFPGMGEFSLEDDRISEAHLHNQTPALLDQEIGSENSRLKLFMLLRSVARVPVVEANSFIDGNTTLENLIHQFPSLAGIQGQILSLKNSFSSSSVTDKAADEA